MRLTKDEAIANHRKMWNWIAEETLKQKCKVEKWEYFKSHRITDIPLRECYCCEYAFNGNYSDCEKCPIEWGGKHGSCTGRDSVDDIRGLYALWLQEPDYIKAAKLAKKIAELPERK